MRTNIRRELPVSASTVVVLCLTFLLSSCSGGFFPSADTIVSLSISPTTAYILPNAIQQFTATATFGNNSTGDVTSQVTWTSSSTSVATINSAGLATGVAVGTTTITAKSTNNVTETAALTVNSKTISAISISPSNPTLSVSTGQTQQFTATATFSDGSLGNVTSQVTWTSSIPSVAVINASGLATPISVGSTTIGASLGGVTGTTSLTVTQ